MRQYKLEDIKHLLYILSLLDEGQYDMNINNISINNISINDVRDLHELNIVFLAKRGNCNCQGVIYPTANIIPFLKLLCQYSEQYDNFITELLDFCTKVTFTYKFLDINYIKILYQHTQNIELIKEAFILKESFIKDLIVTYYRKQFTYDEVQNA